MIVDVDKESIATISVFTDGGYGEYESIWIARDGSLYVNVLGDTELTDCKLNYYCNGWDKDIWLFGDSYFSCWDSERWTSYLCKSNGDNYLLNGYSGRKSDKALESLKHMLLYGKPDEIIWCMGMNDGDGEKEINSSWLSSVEEVIDICETYEIELVLTTIPNCPTINNNYKNEYIRESGYRYIDFADAVGSDDTIGWYDGMLEDCDAPCHPTEEGARCLYTRAVVICPELLAR